MRRFYLLLVGVLAVLLSLVGLTGLADASAPPDSIASLSVPYLHGTSVAPPVATDRRTWVYDGRVSSWRGSIARAGVRMHPPLRRRLAAPRQGLWRAFLSLRRHRPDGECFSCVIRRRSCRRRRRGGCADGGRRVCHGCANFSRRLNNLRITKRLSHGQRSTAYSRGCWRQRKRNSCGSATVGLPHGPPTPRQPRPSR